jgi:hypothetical protein
LTGALARLQPAAASAVADPV